MLDCRPSAIVIGGGQSGLAAGYFLQRAGLRLRILGAGEAPVGTWPRYRYSLILNSPARYASLLELTFPGNPERYPTRDEVVAYLHGYATQLRLPIQTRAQDRHIMLAGPGFQVVTDRGPLRAPGQSLRARAQNLRTPPR